MGLSEFSAANWHKLGVALSISDDTLKIFQANHMGTIGVDRCLSATLAHWYKNTTGGTWGDICAALFAIDERALARKVAKNHGKYVAVLRSVSMTRYQCPFEMH